MIREIIEKKTKKLNFDVKRKIIDWDDFQLQNLKEFLVETNFNHENKWF